MAPGTTNTVSSPTLTAPAAGNYLIRASADATNDVSESSEDNNETSNSMIVLPRLPLLEVLSVWSEPTSPTAGQSYVMMATIKNQGVSAFANEKCFFYVGTTQVGEVNFDVVVPGAMISVSSSTLTAPEQGTYPIKARIEGNSEATNSMIVLPLPNAEPTATMAGVPTTPVLAGSVLNLTLGGQDNDENGQSVVEGELSVSGIVVANPLGSYNLTAPAQAGLHPISYRVRDDEDSWSPPVVANLTVTNAAPIIGPPVLTPDGNLQFNVSGAPSKEYALEALPDLVNWHEIEMPRFATDANGNSSVKVPVFSSEPQRFYRVRTVTTP